MKVLFVVSANHSQIAAFIVEQFACLRELGVDCEIFGVRGRGISGYLKNLFPLLKKMRKYQPDVIHAHYGLCGLLANLQNEVPVVTTYHGSDINNVVIRLFSRLSMFLSEHNIFVSQRCIDISKIRRQYSLIPCGVDTSVFMPISKLEVRNQLGIDSNRKIVLFAGAFDNPVKNSSLARTTVALFPDVELLELKGYAREHVVLLMNAADVLLMTSLSEGSPLVIKEAMACGCPIVSVNVGDVAELVSGVDGCFISERDEESLSINLRKALEFKGRTDGRYRIMERGLTSLQIAGKIIRVYENLSNII